MKKRVALVVSHPIQHFCPQYVSFARNPEIVFKVFFGSALGHKAYEDKAFGKSISWGNLQLDKFDRTFLNGELPVPVGAGLDAPGLDSALLDFKPDLVIIYGYFQKMQRRARAWAIRNKVKIAYISDSELRQKRNVLKEWIKFFLIRKYFRGIDWFLSVGDANESFYSHYGVASERFVRMHFPIDIEQYNQSFAQRDSLRKKVRAQHNIHDNDIALCVVGKLVPWKNQDHLIDAVKRLEESGVMVYLFILGSGDMQQQWELKAQSLGLSSRVLFPGFVPIEQLPAYYAATDIYVHPASVEPHSIAVSEAIYMGCPVVISDRCGSYGATDDVQENRNGHVFRFGDVPGLSEVIANLVADKRRLKEFSDYSHAIAVVNQERSHVVVLSELLKRLEGADTK